MGRLWPHLVLGLLAARRDAPVENAHLDEMWRLATARRPASWPRRRPPWLSRRGSPAGRPAARRPDRTALLELPGPTVERCADGLRRLARDRHDGGRWARPSVSPPAIEQIRTSGPSAVGCGFGRRVLAALPVLEDLGARAVAVVRARLRELGVPGCPAAESEQGPTRRFHHRQLDVLALLAEGLTNTEIAARLVISRKTADHHVSAILGKLDARSRRDAVGTARRLGLEQ